MIIGIDARSLIEPNLTGVGHYTKAMLRQLFLLDQQNQYKLFLNSFKKMSTEVLTEFENLPNVRIYRFNYPSKLLNLSLSFLGRPKLDMLVGGCDLFWLPNLGFYSISSGCKTVITVHDLSFERLPWAYSAKRQLWHKVINPPFKLKLTDKIIAVSKNTKKDLVNLYHLPSGKIEVIYPGVSLRQGKIRKDLPEKYILYLGTLEPRKNIESIIKAFEKLNRPEYSLVIAGSKGWLYQPIYRLAKKSKLKDQIKFVNYVKEEEKFFLYKKASLFIWPSFYEGFGLPPLEAMKAGCPVIAASDSSLPEVLNSGVMLVDPYNLEEIAKAMELILDNQRLKEDLTAKASEIVKKYDWQTSAKQLLEVFNRL
ncbi:MAG: hypothetical protein COU22_01720 [Candidatus Komeilibacteria bacterium CG10_big_fil_rev_8_21_14_0_10_41_13]|uniref:Glycosyltransferase family 1 protein n=1 Tax=Candidatus Komeilibacteria bacterium CG10_big_fil_rev_8_21_14_0_10_41_13 TaxID=1974476 RepID=A0A2M6WCK9_9BACT|nr:MAG: hypothetical protein COU22_01720 [Candidatus Komeilibacteria bacterium CG10_big_fil_rev_8_21_14_0_10_41_13]